MNRRNKKKDILYTLTKNIWYPYTPCLKNLRKTTSMQPFKTFLYFFLIFDNFNGQQINYINFI